MAPSDPTLSRKVTIVNELGLHARSAAQIAKAAQAAQAGVWISVADEAVDATSIIDILTLACGKGSQVIVAVDDPGDKSILEQIVALVESGFGEK